MKRHKSLKTQTPKRTFSTRRRWVVVASLAGALWIVGRALPANADLPVQHNPAAGGIVSQQDNGSGAGRDANCLMCHADHDLKGSFQNGELISLYVDSGEYEQSVHGPAGLECLACHTDINRYPHHESEQVSCVTCHSQEGGTADVADTTLRVQLAYQDRREMTLTINELCSTCHESEFEVAGDSAHVRVLKGGNRNAPVCIDCHGSHNITSPGEPRDKISHVCGACHGAVYSTYRTSIHGTALDADSNPDVPTCTDCHGVHSVRGPRDAAYRNDSIAICGGCHADKALMGKYGISTDVFETYLDDFHGRTVDFFRRQDAGNPSNKAVCFDCHGIHNIRKPDDPLSTIYPANLQHTCQQCHEDADIKFPRAWVSHYLPTWENTPALYVVNTVYKWGLIPGVLGGFLIYIGLDARRRWSDRRRIMRQALALAEEELKDDYDFD
ncbi:MAG: cytochrome c3 family protein [Anaerolineae bacterium]